MFGMPELMMIVAFGLFGVLPWVAGIWALLTLQKMRIAQEAMRASLDRIEQRLQ